MPVHVFEAHVGIGKYDFVDVVLLYKVIQFFFRVDSNAVRILFARQGCRITAILDVRDLCRRERHDLEVRIVAVAAVEHVKITAGGTHDDYFPAHPSPSRLSGDYP